MTGHWITLLTFLPLVGALTVAWGGPRSGAARRRVALLVHALVAMSAMGLAVAFDTSATGMQFVERLSWVPGLGVEYHVGVDGLGMVSVLIAALIPLLAAVVSDRVAAGREGVYYPLLLLLQFGLLGTFTALNFFHWFLFWELGLVPAYLLVRLFGGKGAGPASFQFFVYTMVGSVALLLAFLALRAAGGSFDFLELAGADRGGALGRALAQRLPWGGPDAGNVLGWLVFGGVLLGFAVKVPLWPFHTWLPDTYTAAPSPVTMVLTGAMSKMGVYGLLRIAWPIFPEHFAAAQGVLVPLALATVILPTFTAFVQRDLKRVLAYSSINHLGYCLLAVFVVGTPGSEAGTAAALNGVVLQMLNHALTAATLFGFVEVLERRTGGVRDLEAFGGLRRAAPVFCGLMGISVFASVGLPGLNGFVSEFLIFRGIFAAAPWAAAVASLGLLTTAVFLLKVMQRLFHGELSVAWVGFPDLTMRERVWTGAAVAGMLVLGVYPDLVLQWTNPLVLRLAGGN
ncbi:MAG: NADH-quinone oxidoreductase subunit M [Verrucomicrobiales bacterium]|nr:NADH-quinone oxidoreductase subunit M [Verrucomicrobiales bacterium]